MSYVIVFSLVAWVFWSLYEAAKNIVATTDRRHLIQHHKVINELLHKKREAMEQQAKADINHEETK